MQTISANEARSRILGGQMPMFDSDKPLQISGELDLSGETELTTIPPQIRQLWD